MATSRCFLRRCSGTASTPMTKKHRSGSAAVFDLGVTLIVVGLVVAVPEGIAFTREGHETASAAELRMETSPLCSS